MTLPAMCPAIDFYGCKDGGCWASMGYAWGFTYPTPVDVDDIRCGADDVDEGGLCPRHRQELTAWPPDHDRARLLQTTLT